jgi:hypothetical protein
MFIKFKNKLKKQLLLGFASVLGYFGKLPYKIFRYKNFYSGITLILPNSFFKLLIRNKKNYETNRIVYMKNMKQKFYFETKNLKKINQIFKPK